MHVRVQRARLPSRARSMRAAFQRIVYVVPENNRNYKACVAIKVVDQRSHSVIPVFSAVSVSLANAGSPEVEYTGVSCAVGLQLNTNTTKWDKVPRGSISKWCVGEFQ